MMQDHELDAYLGDDWSPQQRQKITSDWRDFEQRFPDAPEGLSDAVLAAICQMHDGVLEVPHDTAVRAAVIVFALYGGVSEAELARRSGRDRGTIRRWLGK